MAAVQLVKLSISALTMIVGGMLYLAFRETNLLMFHWLSYFDLMDFVFVYRDWVLLNEITLSNWIIFSLPNTLWVISGFLFFETIWHKDCLWPLLFWVFIFSFFSVMAEVLQYFNIVQGTFDPLDILPILAVCFFYFLILIKRKIKDVK